MYRILLSEIPIKNNNIKIYKLFYINTCLDKII